MGCRREVGDSECRNDGRLSSKLLQTAEIDDVSVIFAAQTRALDFSEKIFVWKRAQRAPEKSGVWGKYMAWIIKALVVLGCMVFVYQNLEAGVRVLGKAI
ncbi:hypothetical protein B0H14DRAFT_3492403 [Mycena olivaceomarginata]|nr:hypothetical protein B0H14DRAFT_3492403 [Mycena olivaceomarginata]